jgi:hypothetical protein
MSVGRVGIVVAVVLVQPLQPLFADDLDDGRAHAQVERLRIVAIRTPPAGTRPSA